MKYIAELELENVLETVEFETDGSPVEYLWQRYGMDTYIKEVNAVNEPDQGEEQEDEETKIKTE